MILFIMYRLPDAPPHKFSEILDRVDEEIDMIQANSNKFGNILGFGDSNLPGIAWLDTSFKESNSVLGLQAKSLINFMDGHFLSQLVTSPIRQHNCLDLMLCNSKNLVTKIYQQINRYLSDHNTLFLQAAINTEDKKNERRESEFYSTK